MRQPILVAGCLTALCAGTGLATTTDVLVLTSGATTITVADNSASDTNGSNGTIVYNNSNLDGWDVSFASGTSKSPTLSPFGVDIGSFTASCDGTGCATDNLTISYSDINFTQPVAAGGFTTFFSGTIATGSATQTAYDDTTNTLFGTGTLIGTVGPINAPGGSGTASGGGPAGPSPYSLTLVNVITAGSQGVSVDGNITAVPEPMSIILLGTLLCLSASAFRRRSHL